MICLKIPLTCLTQTYIANAQWIMRCAYLKVSKELSQIIFIGIFMSSMPWIDNMQVEPFKEILHERCRQGFIHKS